MSDETAEQPKAEKHVTLYHPTIAGDRRTVVASDVEAWTASGWRKTPPKKG